MKGVMRILIAGLVFGVSLGFVGDVDAVQSAGNLPEKSELLEQPFEKDAAGRPVVDTLGNRILYPDSPEAPDEVFAPNPVRSPAAVSAVSAPKLPPSEAGAARAGLSALMSSYQPSSVSAHFEDVTEIWRTGIIGDSIGSRGMVVDDIDGDGTVEILAANTAYWIVLEYDPSTASYVVTWVSEFHRGYLWPISQIAVLPLGEDGQPRITLALSSKKRGQRPFLRINRVSQNTSLQQLEIN